MLIFVQYLYGLTWAFSVAYACARLEACAWSKREAVTHYVSRLNPRPIVSTSVPFLFQSHGENENIIPLIVTRVTLSLDCRSSTPDRNFSTCCYRPPCLQNCPVRKKKKKKREITIGMHSINKNVTRLVDISWRKLSFHRIVSIGESWH